MVDGSPDLLLWTDRPIHLGRGVREGEGYTYPNQWNSLSSRHCNLQYQPAADGGEVGRLCPLLVAAEHVAHSTAGGDSNTRVSAVQGQWVVTDTSTNGTYINGVKIGKGKSAVLGVGDSLGLSVICPNGQASAANYHNTVQ